jgi:hypothetical protein
VKIRLALFLSVIALALTALGADQPKLGKSDAELAKLMLGSWTPDPKARPEIDAITTYRADGTVTENVWTRGQQPSTGLKAKAGWSVKNGCILFRIIESNDPNMPVGLELKQRILSLTDDRLDYELMDGYGADVGDRSTDLRHPDA